MAHERKRFLEEFLVKSLGFSPLVGVLGHRQVGKTTLTSRICESYVTFDDEDVLMAAESSPKEFIRQFKGIKNVIDECQMVPRLFPALKEHVRVHKRPGQFILTGSVRFTSRKAIRESLTGRIVNHELLPMTVSELRAEIPAISVLKLCKSESLSQFLDFHSALIKKSQEKTADLNKYFVQGGLPSVCFIRDVMTRRQRISEQLATILDRDLRLVYPTSLALGQLMEFVRCLAKNEGKPIRYSSIKRETGITEPTQKKLLYALEAVFLIRTFRIKGGAAATVIYFEDQAEALHLSDYTKNEMTAMEGLLLRHLRSHFVYQQGVPFQFFHYKTRGGARIPIVIESEGRTLGFLPIENDEGPSKADTASAASFLRAFENSRIIYVTTGSTTEVIDNRSAQIPLRAFV